MKNNLELSIEKIEYAIKHKRIHFKAWLVVADRYLKYYSRGKFERHWTAEDILEELFTKILEGERNWDSEQVPDFNKFIFQNIRSIVEGKLRVRSVVENVDSFEPHAKAGKTYKGLQDGQYEDNIDPGDLIDINDKLEKCYNELSENEECGLVFLEWLEGNTSIQIAKSLGISVAEVESIKKRIRYKLNKKIN